MRIVENIKKLAIILFSIFFLECGSHQTETEKKYTPEEEKIAEVVTEESDPDASIKSTEDNILEQENIEFIRNRLPGNRLKLQIKESPCSFKEEQFSQNIPVKYSTFQLKEQILENSNKAIIRIGEIVIEFLLVDVKNHLEDYLVPLPELGSPENLN